MDPTITARGKPGRAILVADPIFRVGDPWVEPMDDRLDFRPAKLPSGQGTSVAAHSPWPFGGRLEKI